MANVNKNKGGDLPPKGVLKMNKFKKYCPNVWVAECEEVYEKGDIIELETKYGKTVECEVYNLIGKNSEKYFYSIVRVEELSYAERKAEKYNNSVASHQEKSDQYYNASQEGRDFLSLGEPIKVGHHSEKRHRALIERNNSRMEKCIEYSKKAETAESKAEYWANKATQITLANPESIEYFTYKLEQATEYHQNLKNGTIPKEHSYSLTYANKEVKELKQKVEIANLLWNNN